MKEDRKRSNSSSYNPPPTYGMINTYFAPFSVISFLIGFGILIHALQWRYEIRIFSLRNSCSFLLFSMAKFAEPTFAADPRSRSYHAYREWQRLSALKDADSMPLRDSSARRDEDK